MISVIIPVHNESSQLKTLLPYLRKEAAQQEVELIVVGAHCTDDSELMCINNEVPFIDCSTKNRSVQMNCGAAAAKGNTLFFLHADTKPPAGFIKMILNALAKGYQLGRFKTVFDGKSWLLKLNAFFTRFDIFMCYGGDQTLFITKELFEELGGFSNEMAIMEDYEFTTRARQHGKYKIMNGKVIVSTRKYDHNSWLAVQRANIKAVKLYKKGIDTGEIAKAYKNMLRWK